ncbi:MAG TPA: hypothetical protein VLU23_04220 [Pseudolabrys sp.]|nr:hypothetical protein [Pseudolabrys sp.]
MQFGGPLALWLHVSIDTVLVDSLKALDLNRPIREADIECLLDHELMSFHCKQYFDDGSWPRHKLLAQFLGATGITTTIPITLK